ncbi:hypothetical protein ASZ90_020006 [hydrocarbon metagenome]|uniref:Uncharacterized protein n=1 Tax=hydrocarbon metagenome TaxID=938273 RepID=A0A0W8E1Z8_9ZZZZ
MFGKIEYIGSFIINGLHCTGKFENIYFAIITLSAGSF